MLILFLHTRQYQYLLKHSIRIILYCQQLNQKISKGRISIKNRIKIQHQKKLLKDKKKIKFNQMSQIYYSPAPYQYENRLRSDSSFSSSSSTDHLFNDDRFSHQKNPESSKNNKFVSDIILTNFQTSKPSQISKNGFSISQKVEDQEMKNLTLFLNILTEIHSQQSQDQIRKEESAINERKREIRKLKIQKYREKKQNRKWDVLRYEVRKNIAKSRLRIKGRFVRE
ncbi:hypothetical protein ABPG72_011663 [Tetrahymena utriculariae]